MTTAQLLVEKYVPLANKLARQKKKGLPNFIDFDELRSAAYMGLVEAASRFNESHGVSFSTYAYPRINGAIHDYLRELGWGKKNDPHQAVSLDIFRDEEGCTGAELVESRSESNSEELFEEITHDLDQDAKVILRFYFIDELSMREVGDRFGVSESRISQLIKSYKQRICSNQPRLMKSA